jgi:hypothetical protein
MPSIKCVSLEQSAAAAALACGVLLVASAALAQQPPPDPFQDYQSWSGEAPPALPPAQPAPPPSAAAAKATSATVEMPMLAGQWALGGRGMFSYTSAKNDLLAGGSETNTTFFMRLTPTGGVFVADRLQVAGSLGLLRKSLARESGGKATENDWLLEATGSYFLPVGPRFAVVPGVGLGGFAGSSDRTFLLADGSTIDESTGTRGFAASLYLGAAYQLSRNWQLRSGLALTALLGSEKVASQHTSLSSTAVHFGLPVEVYYTFY